MIVVGMLEGTFKRSSRRWAHWRVDNNVLKIRFPVKTENLCSLLKYKHCVDEACNGKQLPILQMSLEFFQIPLHLRCWGPHLLSLARESKWLNLFTNLFLPFHYHRCSCCCNVCTQALTPTYFCEDFSCYNVQSLSIYSLDMPTRTRRSVLVRSITRNNF